MDTPTAAHYSPIFYRRNHKIFGSDYHSRIRSLKKAGIPVPSFWCAPLRPSDTSIGGTDAHISHRYSIVGISEGYPTKARVCIAQLARPGDTPISCAKNCAPTNRGSSVGINKADCTELPTQSRSPVCTIHAFHQSCARLFRNLLPPSLCSHQKKKLHEEVLLFRLAGSSRSRLHWSCGGLSHYLLQQSRDWHR